MYYQKTMDFSEWLDKKLEEKGWSRSEAARRGSVSASMYDKVIRDHHPLPGITRVQGIRWETAPLTTETSANRFHRNAGFPYRQVSI